MAIASRANERCRLPRPWSPRRRYKLFSIYTWPMKAFLKRAGYEPDQLYTMTRWVMVTTARICPKPMRPMLHPNLSLSGSTKGLVGERRRPPQIGVSRSTTSRVFGGRRVNLNPEPDAREALIKAAGRTGLALPGDLRDEQFASDWLRTPPERQT
jgi:hypothetical protein